VKYKEIICASFCVISFVVMVIFNGHHIYASKHSLALAGGFVHLKVQ